MSAVVDMSFAAATLNELWKAIGTELIIFGVTLFFAVVIRKFNSQIGKKTQGKAVAFKDVPSPAKAASSPPTAPRGHAFRGFSDDFVDRFAGTPPPPLPHGSISVGAGSPGVAIARMPSEGSRPSASPTVKRSSVGSPAALINEIIDGVRDQASIRFANRALQIYQEELQPTLAQEGMSIKDAARQSKRTPLELFTCLLHCSVRAGRHHLVEALLDDMTEQGISRPLTFYESAMKQLAGQKQYHLALSVYDRLTADGLKPSAVTCSCLIGFAAEVGELQRAVDFFEALSATTTPSIRAYMTVLRVHSKRQDFSASLKIFREMQERCSRVDSLALNVVLATGVTADQLQAVEDLVKEGDAAEPPITDIVSYNTLMKAFAQRGDYRGALRALTSLKARGLVPNAITFNTAMDAAIRGGKPQEAWNIFADMREAGLKPDKFTCSIMVKGLAKNPTVSQVTDALQLLHDTDGACDPSLRSVLYHTTFDAASHTTGPGGGADLAARVFGQMRRHKVVPTAAAQRFMVHALPGTTGGRGA